MIKLTYFVFICLLILTSFEYCVMGEVGDPGICHLLLLVLFILYYTSLLPYSMYLFYNEDGQIKVIEGCLAIFKINKYWGLGNSFSFFEGRSQVVNT